jgi:hypothetical protein
MPSMANESSCSSFKFQESTNVPLAVIEALAKAPIAEITDVLNFMMNMLLLIMQR